jgi:hypothetical protein
VPLLKLYDVLDPVVVRSARSPDPIAANYTATLAMLLSHGRKVANSAGQAFLRPDNPRFATGIYLIHTYDPNKIPILFIHGLISSPYPGKTLPTISARIRQFSSITNPGFIFIPLVSLYWRALRN